MTGTLIVIGVLSTLTLVLILPPLRRALITRHVFALFKRILPTMSDTEREALEAGTVWWEGELFPFPSPCAPTWLATTCMAACTAESYPQRSIR